MIAWGGSPATTPVSERRAESYFAIPLGGAWPAADGDAEAAGAGDAVNSGRAALAASDGSSGAAGAGVGSDDGGESSTRGSVTAGTGRISWTPSHTASAMKRTASDGITTRDHGHS